MGRALCNASGRPPQVDKQGQTLVREIAGLAGRLEQERTHRAFVQSAMRSSKDLVGTQLAEQVPCRCLPRRSRKALSAAARHAAPGECGVLSLVPRGGSGCSTAGGGAAGPGAGGAATEAAAARDALGHPQSPDPLQVAPCAT